MPQIHGFRAKVHADFRTKSRRLGFKIQQNTHFSRKSSKGVDPMRNPGLAMPLNEVRRAPADYIPLKQRVEIRRRVEAMINKLPRLTRAGLERVRASFTREVTLELMGM